MTKPSIAEQALQAFNRKGIICMNRFAPIACSATAEFIREEPETVIIRHHFTDRSVFEYRTNYGAADRQWGGRTADETLSIPHICGRHCCQSIRHLKEPQK